MRSSGASQRIFGSTNLDLSAQNSSRQHVRRRRMNVIDWILNLAALFLWIDWRSGRVSRRPKPVVSLASAVRPLERRIGTGLGSLAGMIAILLVRPCFYYSIGSRLNWTPQLDLFALSLPWRSDLLDRMYLYSTITFLLTLGFFYSAILFLSAVNRSLPDSEVIQQFIRLQLGWLERLPWPIKLLLPSIAAGLAWIASLPLLTFIELLPRVPAARLIWGQAGALALAALLTWKWLIIAILLLHFLNLYVYLGTHPVWPYISVTARKLLAPLSFLTFPKLDLASLVAVALVFLLSDLLIEPLVLSLFQRFTL